MTTNPRRPFYAEYAWAFDLLIDRPVRNEVQRWQPGWSNAASFRAPKCSMLVAVQAATRRNWHAEATSFTVSTRRRS